MRRKSLAIREQECVLGLGSERMPAGPVSEGKELVGDKVLP